MATAQHTARRYGAQRISYARWVREFEPIVQCTDGNWGGFGMEDFRKQWDTVCLPALRERRLWSGCINEDGRWMILPGNHIVNRDTVILTRHPYDSAIEHLYVVY